MAIDAAIQQTWDEVRALYHTQVRPIVMQSFGLLFTPVDQWLKAHKVELWSGHVTACTFGFNFWPSMHIDHDIWFTVLVVLRMGQGHAGGGDFAFPRMGHVLEMRTRDVFIYNPYELHGTTEIDLTGTPETSGLLLIAFYCKKDGVKGRSGTCAAIPQHM